MATSKFVLKKNDRIVFFGDSITEQQLYTNYVETYLSLRYPELNLTFFNAGWGGDQAGPALDRLERDVLQLKPTVVTLCYGMNDGLYMPLNKEVLAQYAKNMAKLVSVLKSKKIQPVLLTPGYVDTGITPNSNLAQADYNRGMLRGEADCVLRLAKKEKLSCFDIHALMEKVDIAAKKANPGFCMIPDGVHPEPAGHLVMAYGLLKALGVPKREEHLVVDLKAPMHSTCKWKTDAEGTTIDVTLPFKPFFVDVAARKVLPFLPFQEEFNCCMTSIRGLEKGKNYFIESPSGRIEQKSAEVLRAGFDMYADPSSIPVQRSEQVFRHVNGSCQIYSNMWRNMALFGTNIIYDPIPHKLAISLDEKLRRHRQKIVTNFPKSIRLRIQNSTALSESIDNGGFIHTWNIRGPLPMPYDQPHLGDEAAFTSAIPTLNNDWITVRFPSDQLGNCLNQVLGTSVQCCAYAVCIINSSCRQSAQLLLGSDDGFAVWLNGVLISKHYDLFRGASPDQNSLAVKVKQGPNVLLLKITQDGGDWGFYARFKGLRKKVVVTHVL